VRQLRDDLLNAGETVWWDQDIRAGIDWRLEVGRAIRDAYAIILCFSQNTQRRKTSGLYPEAADAIGAYREYPPGSIFLIPVRLSDCQIPDLAIDSTRTLDQLQHMDLFPSSKRPAALRRLLEAIRAAPYHPSAGVPLTMEVPPATVTPEVPSCDRDSARARRKSLDAQRYTILSLTAKRHLERQLADPSLALKYNPEHYVEREMEGRIEQWLGSRQSPDGHNCFLLLAPAGCGKTNLLCHLAAASVHRRPTFLITGAQLYIDERLGLWTAFSEVLRDVADIEHDRVAIRNLIASIASGSASGIVVVFDAINEYPEPARLRREIRLFLQDAVKIGIKIVVSCRDYYMGLFEADWWRTFTGKDNRESLGNFTPEEATGAFAVYFSKYNVKVIPAGNAIEQFRHPLLLRFFCETYRDKNIGHLKDIRLKDLFDTYWVTKLESIAERMLDQGHIGRLPDISQYVGDCLLDIAQHMLENNTRVIPAILAQTLAKSNDLVSSLAAPYGRILDEHIILEELTANAPGGERLVTFVFEEFMEYAMARSLVKAWRLLDKYEVCDHVVALTRRYGDFSQVLGVVLYLALIFKQERGIALWRSLIGLGREWEHAVVEGIRKLPPEQIDDGVFGAITDLLTIAESEIQSQTLELIKFGRLGRVAPPELAEAIGRLTSHHHLTIKRRALLALASCSPEIGIGFIEQALTDRRPIVMEEEWKVTVGNGLRTLAGYDHLEAMVALARIWAIHWYNSEPHKESEAVLRILGSRLNRLIPLLEHNDLVVRLGSATVLAAGKCHDAVPALEALAASPITRDAHQQMELLPLVARHRWAGTLELSIKRNLTLDAYAAKQALTIIGKVDVEQIWRSGIRKAVGRSGFSGLPASLDLLNVPEH